MRAAPACGSCALCLLPAAARCIHPTPLRLPTQIVERGRHAELIDAGGLYAEMWRRQQEAAAPPSSASASMASLSHLPGAQD